jgi:hypothetical protein
MADIPADEPRDVPERAPRTKRWNQIAAIKLKQSNEFLQQTAGRVHHFVDLMNSIVQEVAAEFLFEEDDLLLNESEDEIDDNQVKVDHRQFPRNSRRKYDRKHVIVAINRDYLGPTSLFNGRKSDSMFRIS